MRMIKGRAKEREKGKAKGIVESDSLYVIS